MKTCSISGCTRIHEARGWCDTHYARWKRTGDPLGLVTVERGTAVNKQGYRVFSGVKEHVAVAEKAMGKKLPKGAVVHHIDEDKLNNSKSNLIVCSRAYHVILHARMRAMNACGNPDWVKCHYCGLHSDPSTMWIGKVRPGLNRPKGYHNQCRRAAYNKSKKAIKAGAEIPGAKLVQCVRLNIE